jgi:hypothetical protein
MSEHTTQPTHPTEPMAQHAGHESGTHGDAHPVHVPSDTFTLPGGRTLTLPGGIYTFVFGLLGVLTISEVLIAEALKNADGVLFALRMLLLLVASISKAFLVVYYYMHLNTDNRFFRFTLGIPVFLMLVAALYLLAVPQTG